MNNLLRKKLVEIAIDQTFISYGDLAPLVGLDMDIPYDRGELGRLLGEISTYERQQGRPLLSAVAISLGANKPGDGFFDLARDLGLHTGPDDDAFWAAELDRVHAVWKGKQRPK